MKSTSINVIRGELTTDAPYNTATSRAILKRVSDGEMPETLHVGISHRTVAFGRHDTVTPGFKRAVELAIEEGYDVTIRSSGGRAVVFHDEVIRFTWTLPENDPVRGVRERFEYVAGRAIEALRTYGVSSEIGELPLEYCRGKYSVSVPGCGKVMGSGQRLANRAAQVSGIIVVGGAEIINTILEPVYEVMGLVMDPTVTGSLSKVLAADVGATEIMSTFSEQMVGMKTQTETGISAELTDKARWYRDSHDPRVLA